MKALLTIVVLWFGGDGQQQLEFAYRTGEECANAKEYVLRHKTGLMEDLDGVILDVDCMER
jgi:hypothetical protein